MRQEHRALCFAALRYNGTMWSAADLRGTAAAIAPWWALLTSDIPIDVAEAVRPPEVEPFLSPGGRTFEIAEVEAALEGLSRAGRSLADAGFAMPSQTGRVAGLFSGTGGVPKQPVPAGAVDRRGLVDDRQKTRKHHGRVWQALCLWSAEVVTALAQEGHPVFPGACGENVLIEGVDWATVRPGARLRLGTVVAEVSLPTVPCKQIRPFFNAAAIRRVDHDRHPGCSRWYASVLQPGDVAVGDAVVVEPSAPAGIP